MICFLLEDYFFGNRARKYDWLVVSWPYKHKLRYFSTDSLQCECLQRNIKWITMVFCCTSKRRKEIVYYNNFNDVLAVLEWVPRNPVETERVDVSLVFKVFFFLSDFRSRFHCDYRITNSEQQRNTRSLVSWLCVVNFPQLLKMVGVSNSPCEHLRACEHCVLFCEHSNPFLSKC